MEDPVTIVYEGKIPTSNTAYTTQRYNPNRRILTNEGRIFKQQIIWLASKYQKSISPDIELSYRLDLYGNWMNKPGASTKIKKRDASNLVKLALDAVCEGLGIDDSQFFYETVSKVQSDKEGFSITISHL